MKAAMLLLAAQLAAPAARGSKPSLSHAVAAFNDFHDAEAQVELTRLLQLHASGLEAARAHIYLGLIALNALDSRLAKAEFERALAVEPTIEVPYQASPKARVVFNEAQREFAQQSGAPQATLSSPPPWTAPPQPAPREEVRRIERPRSKVPGLVLTALAAAVLGTGVGFGVWQGQTLHVQDVGQISAAQSQAATQGVVADVCFGVGGGLGVAALVVLLTELTADGAGPEALRAAPSPGGVAAAWAF
ncbi:MAG: hypothetical protein ACYDCL_03820 [Myxococcales bacterium]